MRPFIYQSAAAPAAAIQSFRVGNAQSALEAPAQYLAGGTTLLDLMKLDVMRPEMVIDITSLSRGPLGQIDTTEAGLRLGALAHMSDAAEHPVVRRDFPVVAQSLQLAASQQIRNMATLGGNVLQRTRCNYFRDTTYAACNKRNSGSGCAAIDGFNRRHAVLGVSDHCIATYAGDFAQALIALDATIEISGHAGRRSMPFAALHRPPGDTPHIETTLAPGEMITAFVIPAAAWTRRSLYLKVRDRQSYEFALASAAVALDLQGGKVRQARIALGGVATVPWRAKAAEAALVDAALVDKAIEPSVLGTAADAAFADAVPHDHNAFKIALGKRTLQRALTEAAAMEL
jgi:xanthine dehydrogenase YagS FAD-binding subunit